MTSEVLLDAIGKISGELVERNAPNATRQIRIANAPNAARRIQNANWAKWSTLAASLAVMAGAALLTLHLAGGRSEIARPEDGQTEITDPAGSQNEMTYPAESQTGMTYPAGNGGNTIDSTQEEKPDDISGEEKYVDIAALLMSQNSLESLESSIQTELAVGPYQARYENVTAAASDLLADCRGKELEENPGWYRVAGHEERQYLIHMGADGCTLWKFGSFRSEEYPYRDVLNLIYGVTAGEDIEKITVVAANMDSSDEGKRIQEEIGRYEITDAADLHEFYRILSGMTCYGANNWDRINYGAGGEGVRRGRYLTIALGNGAWVDSLKYTSVGGMFYEYDGVAYEGLSAAEKETVERILRMEDGQDDEAAPSSSWQDVPVDESTYQEAHRYSDEVEAIQAAISEAMGRGELPFVTSSAICENPVRIVVTVNTDEQAEIDKVLAFDPAGGIVEIRYSENRAVLE